MAIRPSVCSHFHYCSFLVGRDYRACFPNLLWVYNAYEYCPVVAISLTSILFSTHARWIQREDYGKGIASPLAAHVPIATRLYMASFNRLSQYNLRHRGEFWISPPLKRYSLQKADFLTFKGVSTANVWGRISQEWEQNWKINSVA